jgi:hypothetical protein
MAATLATAVEERRSLLVAAIPRLAGKTTTMLAALDARPAGVPVHALSTEQGPSLGIPSEPDGGYLLLAEIAQAPFPEYLWGEPVRQAFAAVREGRFALAAALHASGVDEAFDIVSRGNLVPDEDASCLDVVVYIRTFGADWRNPERRVVEAVYEVDDVSGGRARTRRIHYWDEASDTFMDGEPRERIGSGGDAFDRHLATYAQALEVGG